MRFWQATPASVEAALQTLAEFRIKEHQVTNGLRIYYDLGAECSSPDTAESVMDTACADPAHGRNAYIVLPDGRNLCTWCRRPVA